MSFYGIKTGLPFSVYSSDNVTKYDTIETVKDKSISKSMITSFIKDPWAWKNSARKKKTSAMSAGSLLDCLLTEPHLFDSRYVLSKYDKFQSNESKAWRSEMEAAGVTVLKESDLNTAQAQLDAIKAKPEAAAILLNAQFQVAFRHKTSYPFASKGLIDILPDDGETIVDLKTCTASALESKRSLAKHIYDWMYHVQAGAYCDGYSIASGEERNRFKFIFVASTAPYRVAVVELPIRAIMLGADIYRLGAHKFANCLEHNYFPSIWDGEIELDVPEYAYQD
jgi:hypothetical protein